MSISKKWCLKTQAFKADGQRNFPEFESLVFLGIRVHMSPPNYGPTGPTLTLLASWSVDPCFQSKIKLEWLGWFKVVFKIVAGSQSESYDSTISRSVGFISSYKVFLKNIKSQKYIRLRRFQKGRFFKRFFREIGVRKFRGGSCFGDSTFFQIQNWGTAASRFWNIWWKKRK